MATSYFIRVKGVVQGVGFRPFVYKLALKLSLKGWVNNDDKGVNILIQGKKSLCDEFLHLLKNDPPKLATLDEIKVETLENEKEHNSFKIIESSNNNNNKSTIISPDIAICEDCTNDINDPENFRYNYALTNCTNCGPRYSIIKTVPYDRVNTSMSKFPLCKKCEAEYKDPLNRRYHAQPVACEKCGPQLFLYDINKALVSKNIEAIKDIAQKINEGKIVAIKGMGGFHIVCDATNKKAIKNLRALKNRPSKPFAVMFKDINEVSKHTKLIKKEKELINSKEKPIVLVEKSKASTLDENIAPNIKKLGVMVAYTPLHVLLFRYLENPIIATSANLSGEPIIKTCEDIYEKISNIVSYVLDFNREIVNACDDSIVQVVDDETQILRCARGFAPVAIKLNKNFNEKVLALGANQKSSIAIGFDNMILASPYIGDLTSLLSMNYFNQTINTFNSFYDFEPKKLVCDKHPSYESTKWAKYNAEQNKNLKLEQIQHHYAHALATMAEYSLDEELIAFCFDGTGLGDDGKIWGGEVLLASKQSYERVCHFDYFSLLGGEKAVKEPRRVALALLFKIYSLEEVLALDCAVTNAFSKKELELFYKMWTKNLNSFDTSSLGRLFDAVASFANILQYQSYEGETGLQIENFYDEKIKESYEFELNKNTISLDSIISNILKDKDKKVICSKFLNGLVNLCLKLALENKDKKVLLTGGVFQNKILLSLLIKKFKKNKIDYFYSKKTSVNDQSIAIGQVYKVL